MIIITRIISNLMIFFLRKKSFLLLECMKNNFNFAFTIIFILLFSIYHGKVPLERRRYVLYGEYTFKKSDNLDGCYMPECEVYIYPITYFSF